jgi:hypothetical protein
MVENMYQKIGGRRGSVNLNSSIMNLNLTGGGKVENQRSNDKVDIAKMKMYDWILRKIGSKKHYSDYIKLSMK